MVVKPSSPATVPPVPAARSDAGDVFGCRGVDGDDRVVRRHLRTVGERDLRAGPQMGRLSRVEGGRVEAVGRTVDEADAECDEVAVPVV